MQCLQFCLLHDVQCGGGGGGGSGHYKMQAGLLPSGGGIHKKAKECVSAACRDEFFLPWDKCASDRVACLHSRLPTILQDSHSFSMCGEGHRVKFYHNS